jgi:hypothetical protein
LVQHLMLRRESLSREVTKSKETLGA